MHLRMCTRRKRQPCGCSSQSVWNKVQVEVQAHEYLKY